MGLVAKDKVGRSRVLRAEVALCRGLTEKEQLGWLRVFFGKKTWPAFVLSNIHMWPIIEPGPPNGCVVGLESERVDQMKYGTRSGTKSRDGTRVLRDYGLDEHDVVRRKHPQGCGVFQMGAEGVRAAGCSLRPSNRRSSTNTSGLSPFACHGF